MLRKYYVVSVKITTNLEIQYTSKILLAQTQFAVKRTKFGINRAATEFRLQAKSTRTKRGLTKTFATCNEKLIKLSFGALFMNKR